MLHFLMGYSLAIWPQLYSQTVNQNTANMQSTVPVSSFPTASSSSQSPFLELRNMFRVKQDQLNAAQSCYILDQLYYRNMQTSFS